MSVYLVLSTLEDCYWAEGISREKHSSLRLGAIYIPLFCSGDE